MTLFCWCWRLPSTKMAKREFQTLCLNTLYPLPPHVWAKRLWVYIVHNNEDHCLKIEHTIHKSLYLLSFIPLINRTLIYAIIKETVNEYCVDYENTSFSFHLEFYAIFNIKKNWKYWKVPFTLLVKLEVVSPNSRYRICPNRRALRECGP